MYSLSAYGNMAADRDRVDAYAAALQSAVAPGDVVMDLGAGTGLFSLLACRLGARKVYAVETGESLRVARQVAAANGVADRIVFVPEDSTRADLPEPVDVIVSDLRGVLPPFGRHLEVLADARRRHLRPGGILIPLRDTLWAAPVRAPELHARHVAPSDDAALGFDMAPARLAAADEWHRAAPAPHTLVAPAVRWAEIDYSAGTERSVRGEAAWTLEEDATAHGVLAWFDAELAPGIGFSNAPDRPPLIYGRGYFPWPVPVELRAGDRLRVELRADPLDHDYVWTWTTHHHRGGGDEPAGSFRQCSGIAAVPDPEVLRRSTDSHVPTLSDAGRVDAAILARMDGTCDLARIAEEIAAAFPERFTAPADALPLVRRLSRVHAR